jgi:hypothetical protein
MCSRWKSHKNEFIMKYKLLFISLLGLLTFSCKKNKQEATQNEILKDEIIYNDISPDKDIQTVKFFTFQNASPVCTANVPTPTDSTVNYEIDLNNDTVSDFIIKVNHSKYTSGYCGHCDVFTYSIAIEGLSANDSIAAQSNIRITKLFNDSDTIDNNNKWIPRGNMLLLEGCALPFTTDFSNGFIAVKINKSFGYIHIDKLSNNGIRILEYGFNKTENNIIKCGQK